MRRLVAAALFAALPFPALSACYAWPLRSDLAYDGDMVLLTIPELPPELRDVSARLLHLDAPELDAKCAGEKLLALQARDELRAMLAGAKSVEICPVNWDKYRGRLDAMVWAEGVDVGDEMMRWGLALPYDGGVRPTAR